MTEGGGSRIQHTQRENEHGKFEQKWVSAHCPLGDSNNCCNRRGLESIVHHLSWFNSWQNNLRYNKTKGLLKHDDGLTNPIRLPLTWAVTAVFWSIHTSDTFRFISKGFQINTTQWRWKKFNLQCLIHWQQRFTFQELCLKLLTWNPHHRYEELVRFICIFYNQFMKHSNSEVYLWVILLSCVATMYNNLTIIADMISHECNESVNAVCIKEEVDQLRS